MTILYSFGKKEGNRLSRSHSVDSRLERRNKCARVGYDTLHGGTGKWYAPESSAADGRAAVRDRRAPMKAPLQYALLADGSSDKALLPIIRGQGGDKANGSLFDKLERSV